MNPAQHIEKARRLLAGGNYMLSGDYGEEAGRAAYLAGMHAAMAYLVSVTGKHFKSHSGVSGEFARLARSDSRVDPGFTSFLGRAYALKTRADYDEIMPVRLTDAEQALIEAAKMIDMISAMLPSTQD